MAALINHKFDLDSRLNIGLNYRYDISERDKVDFSLGLVRGNTLFANFAVHSNLNFSGKPRTIMGRETLKEPYLEPYPRLNQEWKKYVTDSIIWQMANMGFVTHQIIFDDNELIAEITQGRFLKPIFAIDLASRVLANNAPKNIEIITVINIERGIETFRASIPRETIVKSASKGPLDEKLLVFNQRENDELGSMAIDNDFLYPHFSWSIRPHLNGTLQHQIKFYFWQLEALFAAEYAIKKGLYINTKIGIDIVSNLDKYTWHVPDGELHNVRQDRRLYLTEGESGIRQLSLEYLLDLHPNVKARLAAGYLEWMYGGFGGETLYISDDRSWALGLEAWWVKQREFDQKFSFQDYETVTGFLTYYQDLPFYDMRLKIRAGKFLGTDTGAHIDISRRFATGARVGGIVALTNCDAVCTGEGSFNKWIYFQLPMNLFYQQSTTREKIGYSWAPLTKNSGTVVETGSGLYNLMTHANDEIDVNRLQPWSIKKIFSGFSRQPKERI